MGKNDPSGSNQASKSDHMTRCSACVEWVEIEHIVTHYLQEHPDLVPGDIVAGLAASEINDPEPGKGRIALDTRSSILDQISSPTIGMGSDAGGWQECPVCENWVPSTKMGMHDEQMHPEVISTFDTFDVGNTENPGEW